MDFCLFKLGRLPAGSISLLRRTFSTVLLLSPKLVQSSSIVDPLPLAWHIRIFINSTLVYWVNFKNFGPDIFNWVVQLRLSEGEELLRRSFSCNCLKWTARFARVSQKYLKKHVRIGFRWWHNGFEGLCGFAGYVACLCLWETTLKLKNNFGTNCKKDQEPIYWMLWICLRIS